MKNSLRKGQEVHPPRRHKHGDKSFERSRYKWSTGYGVEYWVVRRIAKKQCNVPPVLVDVKKGKNRNFRGIGPGLPGKRTIAYFVRHRGRAERDSGPRSCGLMTSTTTLLLCPIVGHGGAAHRLQVSILLGKVRNAFVLKQLSQLNWIRPLWSNFSVKLFLRCVSIHAQHFLFLVEHPWSFLHAIFWENS